MLCRARSHRRVACLAVASLRGVSPMSAKMPELKAPARMALTVRFFGKNVTTRTLETVRKCASA